MRAHEAIAERLFYLGGTPTTKPTEIVVGKTLKEMIQRDIKDEENAVNLYKEIIARWNTHNKAHRDCCRQDA